MTVTAQQLHVSPKIDKTEDFSELKQYACAKVGHMKEWYLQCVDCAQQKKCAAGTQAVKLMESSTTPKAEVMPDPKKDLRGYIEFIFTKRDPLREVLTSAVNIKPSSAYNRVYLWKKNFPDLDAKYHMLDRFKFLWNSPYNMMRVTDILKMLDEGKIPETTSASASGEKEPVQKFPKTSSKESVVQEIKDRMDFHGKYAGYTIVSEKSPIPEDISTTYPDDPDDEVSLEDFLNECRDKRTEKEEDPVVGVAVLKAEKSADIREVEKRKDHAGAVAAAESDLCSLEDMLQKLRKNIADYQQKIKQAEDQISAILTVQQLMRDGV